MRIVFSNAGLMDCQMPILALTVTLLVFCFQGNMGQKTSIAARLVLYMHAI